MSSHPSPGPALAALGVLLLAPLVGCTGGELHVDSEDLYCSCWAD